MTTSSSSGRQRLFDEKDPDETGYGSAGGGAGAEHGGGRGDARFLMDVSATHHRQNHRLLSAGLIITALNLILLLLIVTIVGVVLVQERNLSEQINCIGSQQNAAANAKGVAHPLDALTTAEMDKAATVLITSKVLPTPVKIYNHVALREPIKSNILAWQSGSRRGSTREAMLIVTTTDNCVYEVSVDLTTSKANVLANVTGKQPSISTAEFETVTPTILRNATAQQAILRRGLRLNWITCVAYSVGYFGVESEKGKRLVRATCYDKSAAKNYWGRPIEGLVFDVDLVNQALVNIVDLSANNGDDESDDTAFASPSEIDFDETTVRNIRKPPNAIVPSQANGPTYTIAGSMVTWQNWQFHVRPDPRVGLILSLVTYQDPRASAPRSILYEAFLSEMFVPYMETTFGWSTKTFFDIGEYGFGLWMTELVPGDSVPANSYCWDANYADSSPSKTTGGISTWKIKNALCVFERYHDSNQWLHNEMGYYPYFYQSRPKTTLVVRAIATVGNYDYVVDIEFGLDGTITFDVGATGVDSVQGPQRTEDDSLFGTRLNEQLRAIYHDHFFNFRLDFDIDGTENTFIAQKLERQRYDGQTDGGRRKSGWTTKDYEMGKEQDARMIINFENPAMWKVVNPNKKTSVGNLVGYSVKPSSNALSLLAKDDYPQIRAGFTDYHMWVTPYNRSELYAAGWYPNQNPEADGLPKWTSQNREIQETDIVLWYTMGFHHVPKQEDFPVMPTTWHRFQIVPVNFFERNPSVDLPSTAPLPLCKDTSETF